MKVRIYYDAKTNLYYPQYRHWFAWRYFETNSLFFEGLIVYSSFLKDAISFLEGEKLKREEEKSGKAVKKLPSGEVYRRDI